MPSKLPGIVLFFLVLVSLTSCIPGKFSGRRNITVAFYNVENLFDTINSQGYRDAEFTPDGTKLWTGSRYLKKIDDIAKVIHELSPTDLPEIVGLCEVENEQVLSDLIKNKYLADGNYQIVHFNSPDLRGIDCALIYRPEEFKVLHNQIIPVSFPAAPKSRTRDILYVKGQIHKNNVIHIFINHWPSRIGSVEQTENKRLTAAGILKGKVDSVLFVNPEAKILIMGDMNDEPGNRSLTEVLSAAPPSVNESALVNLMFTEYVNGNGSYKYRGKWNMLDHLIVSASLLSRRGWYIEEEQGYVFRQDWMEYVSPTGLISPHKTYKGSKYMGGVSDHFPVYFRLRRY